MTWNRESLTNGQLLEACYLAERDARAKLARLRELDQELPIGDPRRNGDANHPPLWRQIEVAASDVRQFRSNIAYWRGRCVAEGDDVVAGARAPARPSWSERGDDIAEIARRRMNDIDAGRIR